MTLKAGTRIEVSGISLDWQRTWEAAEIARWNEKVSGPRDKMPGWHIVKFAGGGTLCVHESRFRVVDNGVRNTRTLSAMRSSLGAGGPCS